MPSPEKVLLRKSADGTWAEVGVLGERLRGKTWELTLPDGTEVEHAIQASESYPERGSLSYRLKVDLDGVAADLETAPAGVFLLALEGFRKGATSSQLKQAFVGVDPTLVDRAWRRAKKQLDASHEVVRSDAKIPTYALTAKTRTSAEGDAIREGSGREAAAEAAHIQSGSSAPSSEPVPREQPGSAPQKSPTRGETGSAAETDGHPTGDLIARHLSEQGWDEAEAVMASSGQRPLKLGQSLGRLKAAELADLLANLDEGHRALLAIALGNGKERLLETDADRLSQPSYVTALRCGVREVHSAPKDQGLVLTLTSLMERATATYDLPLELLAVLAETYAAADRERGQGPKRQSHAQTGLERALEAAAKSGDLNVRHGAAAPDLARLARASRQAAFTRTGGRSLLVATLFRLNPDQARSEAWWHGATFDELAEAGHGPLAQALEDSHISESVVRPLVDAALEQAQSRSRLGQIISAPAPLARWVSGERLKVAILRTGNRDEVASAWAEALTDHHELDRMRVRLNAAQREANESVAQQHALQQRVAHLEQRLTTVGEELAAARAAQGETRGVHERQVRADLVRVLAKVAAQVSQSAAASEDAGLMRSVGHAVAREGLDPIGQIARRSTFDPALHDPMGQTISPESQVTVVRPGYTWRDGRDTVVLLKAQVVPAGE